MSGDEFDFKKLADDLLADARNFVPSILPGGKLKGAEYCCGDLHGKPGDSCRVNLNTGKWADFAADQKGGDLISLYAAIQGVKQIDAAKDLAGTFGADYGTIERKSGPPATVPPKEDRPKLPPDGTPRPNMSHSKFGDPTESWCYPTLSGKPAFYVARYDTDDGKQFLPWSWFGHWKCKAWPAPRPLYGLDLLKARPDAPVLVVEGEKACEAARKIAGDIYVVVTWPNGSKAVKSANFSPLKGRHVLLWPDNDDAGISAMNDVANILTDHCLSIKIIKTG